LDDACQSASLRPCRPVMLFSTDQIMSFFKRAVEARAMHRRESETSARWRDGNEMQRRWRWRPQCARTVQVTPAAKAQATVLACVQQQLHVVERHRAALV
jgi:hypothetical protein